MKKIVIALACAGLISGLAPVAAHAGELEEMKQALQKLQERITQLEARKEEPRPAPSSVPLLSGTAFGGNPSAVLYGKLDLFTEYNTGGNKGDRLAVDSGGLHGSRLGLKGGADIKEGLRAIYQLEAGLFATKGTLAQGGKLFGRQAYVGVESAAYGRLTAGRQYSPMFKSVIAHDAFDMGYGSPTTDGNVSTGGIRFDNSIIYATPTLAGLSASAMLALSGETGKRSDAVALAVNYVKGPLGLTAAYQRDDHNGTATAVVKNAFFGTSYQFSKTRLLAGLGRMETNNDNGITRTRREWMLGSQTQATATGQLLLAYAEGRTEDASPDDKGRVATVGWLESISAQSNVYGIVSAHKNAPGSALVPMGTSAYGRYAINPGDSAYGLALGYQYSF